MRSHTTFTNDALDHDAPYGATDAERHDIEHLRDLDSQDAADLRAWLDTLEADDPRYDGWCAARAAGYVNVELAENGAAIALRDDEGRIVGEPDDAEAV